MSFFKDVEHEFNTNPIIQKGKRIVKWGINHPDKVRKMVSDLGKNIGTDSATEAGLGTAAEPGGGTAVGAWTGALTGIGQTAFENWDTLEQIAKT